MEYNRRLTIVSEEGLDVDQTPSPKEEEDKKEDISQQVSSFSPEEQKADDKDKDQFQVVDMDDSFTPEIPVIKPILTNFDEIESVE